MRTPLAVLATIPLALGLAGCSSASAPEPEPTTATPTITATPTPTPTEPQVTVEVDDATAAGPSLRLGGATADLPDTDGLQADAMRWGRAVAAAIVDGADLPTVDGYTDADLGAIGDRVEAHAATGADVDVAVTASAGPPGTAVAATVTTADVTTEFTAVDVDGTWSLADMEAR